MRISPDGKIEKNCEFVGRCEVEKKDEYARKVYCYTLDNYIHCKEHKNRTSSLGCEYQAICEGYGNPNRRREDGSVICNNAGGCREYYSSNIEKYACEYRDECEEYKARSASDKQTKCHLSDERQNWTDRKKCVTYKFKKISAEGRCPYTKQYRSICKRCLQSSDEHRKTYCNDWSNYRKCITYMRTYDYGKINPDVTPYGCQFKDRCEKLGKGRYKDGRSVASCWDGTYYEACMEYPANIKKLGCEHKDRCEKYKKLNSSEKEHLCYRNYDYYKKCSEYENYCKQAGCEYKNQCENYAKYDEWKKLEWCHKAHKYKNCKQREEIVQKKAQQKATTLERLKKGGILVAVALIISILLELIGII